ncbi:MAG: alpha/beta hydrolase [Sneathiella sp.]|nr:MAG: alpha/beta hydrolase [Sneathiella sp.]
MNFLENGQKGAALTLILAHSAGAPMDSPFMNFYAEKLAGAGFHILRFDFPYMQERRMNGGRRPPDRQPKLLECWRQAIAAAGPASSLVIGGKSMSGRMASMIADEAQVKGLVCLGYPFYAPKKLDKPRIEHLLALKTPTLIVQGSRDTMGSREIVAGYSLSENIDIRWLEDGDHSFKPRKKSGRTELENWQEGVDHVAEFMNALT